MPTVTWKKLAYESDVVTKALLTEQGDVIYASAPNTPAALPHGNVGEVLNSGGDGANPYWGAGGSGITQAEAIMWAIVFGG